MTQAASWREVAVLWREAALSSLSSLAAMVSSWVATPDRETNMAVEEEPAQVVTSGGTREERKGSTSRSISAPVLARVSGSVWSLIVRPRLRISARFSD